MYFLRNFYLFHVFPKVVCGYQNFRRSYSVHSHEIKKARSAQGVYLQHEMAHLSLFFLVWLDFKIILGLQTTAPQFMRRRLCMHDNRVTFHDY